MTGLCHRHKIIRFDKEEVCLLFYIILVKILLFASFLSRSCNIYIETIGYVKSGSDLQRNIAFYFHVLLSNFMKVMLFLVF